MAVTFGYAYPSGTNPFVPRFDAKGSGKLIVSYSRNPKDFAVNKLVTITPRTELSGYYARFDPSVLSRVNDLNSTVWADGQPAPTGDQNKQRFAFVPYAMQRRAEPFYVGYQERDQAVWDVDAQGQDVLGQRMMSWRALEFYQLIQNANNYLASNTSTATALSGGLWSAATGSNPYIKIGLRKIVNQIVKITNAAVSRKDLTLLLSPDVAGALAETQEIREYLARSVFALKEIRGNEPDQNENWGLPDRLYGINVVVDPTIQNAAFRDQDPSYNFMTGANEAIILCRPGDLVNTGQFATAFSSVHMFSYTKEEMLMETFDEFWNKRVRHMVTDTRAFQVVSPETLYRVTSVLS